MHVTALAASHRPTSINAALLGEAVAIVNAAQRAWVVNQLSYDDITALPHFNDAQREADGMPDIVEAFHQNIVTQTHSWLLAVPEYNWSYPATLKNMIDWLSCYRPVPFTGQTAMLMCATPSPRGGVIGMSHLKTVLEALGVHVYPNVFTLGNAYQHLDAHGLTSDEKRNQLSEQIHAYMHFSAALSAHK